jgi:hypothetical protein
MKKVYILFLLISSLLGGCGHNNSSPGPSSTSSGNCVTGKGCVNLTWEPPKHDDGTLETISGYKVYYGNSSRTYTTSLDAGKSTSFTVTNLAPGTYYFAVTAYLVGQVNLESTYSNEVSTATNFLEENKSQLIELSPSTEAIIEIH